LLGSVEFLATLKCLLLSVAFFQLSFDKNTQKCPNLEDMSELRDFTVPKLEEPMLWKRLNRRMPSMHKKRFK
jgi:hypothetical protein